MLVPMVLALDDAQPDDRIVDLAECLVEPLVANRVDNGGNIDHLERGVLDIEMRGVREVGHLGRMRSIPAVYNLRTLGVVL